MKIGNMRHRITFEKKVPVPDGYKGNAITWQPVCVVWAEVEPLSGRERFYANQIQTEVTHKIGIRYNGSITTEMRILHKGRAFDIESIIDIKEAQEFQTILAREQKP